jgi:hypothetical protein
MPYDGVLVHSAAPVALVDGPDPPVEGDRDLIEQVGTAFPCCLFLPLPGEENRRGRQVREPLILLPGNVTVSRLERLRITAPEVTGPDPLDWQVQGVQPFGRPGSPLVGQQATLRRVED